MRILILIFPFLFCLTCAKLSEPIKQVFVLPVIVSEQEPDSLRKFEAQSIVPNSAILFGGVFPFTDTLNFITWKPEPVVLPFQRPKGYIPYDSLPGDGLEIFPDYSNDVYWDRSRPYDMVTLFYPVYVVNQSPNPKAFYGRDGYVITIQEAQDSSGRWFPIESVMHWTCMTWRIQLDPQHFLMLFLPKYKGKFKTQLRLRVKNGEQIYVSKAYEGWINPQQFKLHQNSYLDLKLTPLIELSNRDFLGSLPKDAENEEAFRLNLQKSTFQSQE
jgi:hypothetical protein